MNENKNNKIKTILPLILIFSCILHEKIEARGGWGAFAGGAITGAALSGAFSRPSEVYYVEQPPRRSRYNYDDYEYNRRLKEHNKRLLDDQQRLREENLQLREEAKIRDENYEISRENQDLKNEDRRYGQIK